MKLMLTLIFFMLTSMAHASNVERIHSLVEKTLYTCGDRIWPQLNWKSFEINLVSSTEAVQISNGKLISLDPLKANLKGKFRFEKNGITLNLDFFQSPQVAFEFMVHELFHSVGQKQLRASFSAQQDSYPANHLPRLEREELAQALKSYLLKENRNISNAATWFYRHQSHNEDLSADMTEGSAEYVEAIASGLSKLGCKVSEDKLIEFATNRISENGMPFDKSLEHYRIGALSFLVARSKRISPIDSFRQNIHPLFLVTTRSQIDSNLSSDPLLDHSSEMITDLANRRNREVIDRLSDSKHFVFISFKNVSGSFDHRGSFEYKSEIHYEDLRVNTIDEKEFNGHAVQKKLCGSTGFLIGVEKEIKSKKSILHNSTKVFCH